MGNNDSTCFEICKCICNVNKIFSKLYINAFRCNTRIIYARGILVITITYFIYRYVRKGSLYTKGYLFLICNSLIFFFSLPIIEIFVTMNKSTNDNNSTKHFPFIALYPNNYYNFPMYEVKVLFFSAYV